MYSTDIRAEPAFGGKSVELKPIEIMGHIRSLSALHYSFLAMQQKVEHSIPS
jgi:hypothetical protein